MQVVWWKGAAVFLEYVRGRLLRPGQKMETAFTEEAVALFQVAGAAGGHHVCPGCAPAPRPRYYMFKGQVFTTENITAILAGELVSQKYVESSKGGSPRDRDIVLERNNTGQADANTRGPHFAVVFGDYVDAVEKDRFHCILP